MPGAHDRSFPEATDIRSERTVGRALELRRLVGPQAHATPAVPGRSMSNRVLSLRDLSLIDAIAFAGSISGAARTLGVSQPALSRRLVELEGRIGLALVLRGSRGSAPTLAGARLLEAMTLVADELHEALASARDAPVPYAGDVLIGLPVAAPLRHNLHQVILDIAREDPATHVLSSQIPFLRQLASVLHGVLDVGFGLEPITERDGCEGALVWRGALDVILVPAWHPLATRSVIALRDLGGETIGVPDGDLSPDFARRMRLALGQAGYVGTIDTLPHDGARGAIDVARGERMAIASSATRNDSPGVIAIVLETPLMVDHTFMYWRRRSSRRVRSFVQRVGVVAG